MKHTKFKLSESELNEIRALLRPKIEMNFTHGQSILTPHGDFELARETLYHLALAKGAPTLPDGQYYGLAEDGTIVSPLI